MCHKKKALRAGWRLKIAKKYLYDTLINSDARKSKSCSKGTRKTHSGTNSRHLEASLIEVGLAPTSFPGSPARGGKILSSLPSLICINFSHHNEARDFPKHGFFRNRNGSTRACSGNIFILFSLMSNPAASLSYVCSFMCYY